MLKVSAHYDSVPFWLCGHVLRVRVLLTYVVHNGAAYATVFSNS